MNRHWKELWKDWIWKHPGIENGLVATKIILTICIPLIIPVAILLTLTGWIAWLNFGTSKVFDYCEGISDLNMSCRISGGTSLWLGMTFLLFAIIFLYTIIPLPHREHPDRYNEREERKYRNYLKLW
ncbi:MAG: hypothetical protein Q7S12_04225 [bacterium]|nr:hypothetical protein [bacterium]